MAFLAHRKALLSQCSLNGGLRSKPLISKWNTKIQGILDVPKNMVLGIWRAQEQVFLTILKTIFTRNELDLVK